MATLQKPAPASHPITASHRNYAAVRAPLVTSLSLSRYNLSTNISLRVHKEVSLHVKKRTSTVYASNTNPSDQSSDAKKISTDTGYQGPPFLTILAGLVVFSAICWIIGSIVMWLVGLIVHPPSLK